MSNCSKFPAVASPTNCAVTDTYETNPTSYSSSCYEFWIQSLGDRGDFHTAREVERLARDKGFRAEFNDRYENWESAMNVVKRFAKSRTADRRDRIAFNRFRKRMPAASLGFTEEVRLYSLDLFNKASVSDAVEVVQAEVDLVERLYLESGGNQPGGIGKCDTAHTHDQRKVISLADKVAVARMLLRHLPATPQTMSRGAFLTRGSEGQAMVAALCLAVMIVIGASCQRQCRKILCRRPRLSSSGSRGSRADRRQNSPQSGTKEPSAKPDCSDSSESKKSSSQRQQRRRRKTKAVPTVPSPVVAASTVVEGAESKNPVQTPGTAGAPTQGTKNKSRQIVQDTPSGAPTAQSRRPKAKSARPPQKAATPVTKAAPSRAEAGVARDDRVMAAPQPAQHQQKVAARQTSDLKELLKVAQPEAEPEQELHEQQVRGVEAEQRVPQAQEVNSAVSEDLRAIAGAGRKRQLSQPVSDVSEISSVDGDTVSSAGSDAGSVGGQSGSSYGHISPSYGVHHAVPQENMSWAQKLRSGMATKTSDTSDSDTTSISSLEDSYSFRSEASCRRRLSTVCSVNNTDGEDAAGEAPPNSHTMQYEDERFGPSSAEGMDGVGRRGRARSRALRPTYSVEGTSSDSESDQDLAAGRARVAALRTKRKPAAAIASAGSTCHCIDEVWDGRLPEGVLAAKLHAADGGVLGRSAALGTIPLELQHPARHYHGLRPYRSWDGTESTLSSVMEVEALTAPVHQQERGADGGGRGLAPADATATVAATPGMLARARSVDASNVGAQRRRTVRSVLPAVPAPVVAPLPFALRASTRSGDSGTAAETAATTPVSPPCGPSPTSPPSAPASGSGPAPAAGQAACPEVEITGTNTAEPLIATTAVRSSTSGGSRGRAGPAAIAALMGKKDDFDISSRSSGDDMPAPETSRRRQEGSLEHQFVPVPVHVPCQWPMLQHPAHAMIAEHRLACRHAIEKQMLFYFSAQNVSRDNFLRSNMDEEGYVSLGKYLRCQSQRRHLLLRVAARSSLTSSPPLLRCRCLCLHSVDCKLPPDCGADERLVTSHGGRAREPVRIDCCHPHHSRHLSMSLLTVVTELSVLALRCSTFVRCRSALELRVGPSDNGHGPAASSEVAEVEERRQIEAHSAVAQQPVLRSTDSAMCAT